MIEQKYTIIVSPEVLKGDVTNETYSTEYNTFDFGVYSGMSYTLSGNTNGTSFLTGLTIPIFFTQSINDLGVYSGFDGDILQSDVTNNFLYSASTLNPYDIYFYNTSGDLTISYLTFSTYYMNWGDGSSTVQVSNQPINHVYPNTPSGYTISLSGVNTWGTTIIQKQINLPATGVTITNLEGSVTLTPNTGNWSGIPQTYDFIFTGDSLNNYQNQISSSYVQVPFDVSGYTKSKINSLRGYGVNPFNLGVQLTVNGQVYGQIDDITPLYTAYTINNIKYYDLPDGKTLFVAKSSGFTTNNITVTGITKNETFLDFVMDPEIQSEVYVERGKYSGFESLQRLNEVDNIGDLVRYGYNYFIIKTT